MSRRIAKLLNQSEAEISTQLAELEKRNGFPSHDARYIADTHQTLRRKLKELQLDPDDTTARELFHAMQVKFEADTMNMDRYFKSGQMDISQKTKLALKLIGQSVEMPAVWALKSSAVKKLLKELPPKHVMKSLNYRSIASLLKREKTSTVLVLAEAMESGNWHKSLNRGVSRLNQTCFEARQLELTSVQTPVDTPLVVSDLAGAVAFSQDVPLLSMLVRLSGVLKDYGVDAKSLYGLNSLTGWWAETDNLVAELEDGQVSMNIHDVAASWLSAHDFEDRQLQHCRRSYWKNLLDKYENKAHLEETFDDSVINRIRSLNIKGPQPAFEFEYAEDL